MKPRPEAREPCAGPRTPLPKALGTDVAGPALKEVCRHLEAKASTAKHFPGLLPQHPRREGLLGKQMKGAHEPQR